jgi:hypothetical protein
MDGIDLRLFSISREGGVAERVRVARSATRKARKADGRGG